MKLQARSILACALLSLSSLTAFAGDGTIKIKVSLKPAGSFVAESEDVKVRGKVQRNGTQVKAEDIILDLDTLKTGISLRDRHMKEKYFETGKSGFKYAQLMRAEGNGGKLSGEVSIHGVTRPFNGTYTLESGKFIGSFKLKVTEFGMEAPKYMGVGVSDEVTVDISLPESLASRAPSSVRAAPQPKAKALPRR
jgi:hypothetical protein